MKKIMLLCLLLVTAISVAQTQTHLNVTTDRDIYALGDQIQFVAELGVDEIGDACHADLHLLLLDLYGSVLSERTYRMESCRFSDSYSLQNALPDGLYQLIAYTDEMEDDHPSQVFSKSIIIRELGIPGLIIQAEMDSDYYAPGAEVKMRVISYFPDGQLAPRTSFTYDAMRNGVSFDTGRGRTNREGYDEIKLLLPLESDPAVLHVEITAELFGNPYNNSVLIPSENMPLLVDFYPEGGLIFDGQTSKIAFTVTDLLGQALAISGKLVDQYSSSVQEVKTSVPGLGMFEIVADAAQPLSLVIDQPVQLSKKFKLPKTQAFGVRLRLLSADSLKINFEASINVEDTFIPVWSVVRQYGKEVSKERFYISKPRIISIPVASLQTGIVQLVLVGEKNVTLAQVEAFVHKTQQIQAFPKINYELLPQNEQLQLTLASDNPAASRPVSLALIDEVFSPEFGAHPSRFSTLKLGPALNSLAFATHLINDQNQLNLPIIEMAMLTHPVGQYEHADEVKEADDFKTQVSKYFEKNSLEQLLATIKVQQFIADHYLRIGKERPTYLAENRMAFEEMDVVPTKMSQDERIQRQLAQGKSVASVLMSIKPYKVVSGQIVFRGADSFNFQGGAVIVIDGINKGSNMSELESVNPYDVETITASASISDVIKYTGMENSAGIVEIKTKKGDKGQKIEELIKQYNPTIYWNPNFIIPKGGYVQVDLAKPEIESRYRLSINGRAK